MSRFDYIIIGSGISGMSFAHHKAKAGETVLVIDKKDYAGGCLKSLRVDDFWLEMGGHTIYNSYQMFISTLRELRLEKDFIPREKASFKLYDNGEIKPLMSALSKFELAMNGIKLFFKKKDGKTVKEYYSDVLGKGNYERMFRAMISAVISQDASDFPADMLLKRRERDVSAPRNFTIKGGMQRFTEAIAEQGNVTVMNGQEAVDIRKGDDIFTVETDKGEKLEAENITLACPAKTAGKLLEGCAPEISAVLSEIKGVKVETMGLVIGKNELKIDPFSFIIAADEPFTSAVSRDVLPHEKYRGVAFHFTEGALDTEGKISKIEDVLGIDRSAIIESAETVHFSPTLGLEHKERIKRLDKALAKTDGIYVVGNYFGGLAIEDCALRSVQEHSRSTRQ